MIPFTYEKVDSERAAIAAVRGGGRYLAGGTTLVDLMRDQVEQPTRLIDINALPLNYIKSESGDLVIGALTRMSDVAASPAVQRLQPVVSESLIEGASPQLRNMASIGGNLLQRVRCPYFRMLDAPCNKRAPGSGCSAIQGAHAGNAILGTSAQCSATHPSDLAVALVALDAQVHVRGPEGTRQFPVEALYRLPGKSPHLEHTLRPGELIVEVRIPPLPYAERARYLKVRDRASYEFALVSAAAAFEVQGGVIQSARLACGGVGTRPWRMRAAERALQGKPPTRESFEAAARTTIAGATPLPHNTYKVALLQRTVVRALELVGEKR